MLRKIFKKMSEVDYIWGQNYFKQVSSVFTRPYKLTPIRFSPIIPPAAAFFSLLPHPSQNPLKALILSKPSYLLNLPQFIKKAAIKQYGGKNLAPIFLR